MGSEDREPLAGGRGTTGGGVGIGGWYLEATKETDDMYKRKIFRYWTLDSTEK